ncbi:C40 family peptidase [Gorillibacterium sp. sgz5001074]|uniref:C40 family peptidase n=1 Tax=Gorillibacterium sp. sgz5001074 TaxID=3446695 RepID=UPI003F667EFE
MRKPLILFTAASLLLGSAASEVILPSPARAETVYSVTLKAGTSSTAVTVLQNNLKELGYFTYPTATGYYGSITTASVSAYQSAYGLPATGNADPATLTSIDHALVKKKLAADTYTYLRTPYVWGGATPNPGFDCSGFVYFMFTKFGVSTVRTTSDNLYKTGSFVPRASLQPGDLVFFSIGGTGSVDHVGFYLGNNQFMSATRSAGIYPQSLDSTYWGPKYMGAKRVY